MSDPLNDLLKAAKSALDWFDAGLVGSALDEPAEQVDFPAQDLRAAIAAAESASTGWQPIETAPKNRTWIWVSSRQWPVGHACKAHWSESETGGGWYLAGKCYYLSNLNEYTHWHPYTPLPALP
jgi:hypothetical protein